MAIFTTLFPRCSTLLKSTLTETTFFPPCYSVKINNVDSTLFNLINFIVDENVVSTMV